MKKIKKPVSILLSLIMVFSLFTIVPLSASAAVGDVLSESEYLTFTAEEAGATVTLKVASGSNLQYDLNGAGLTDYTAGTEITLENKGDYVRFSGKDTTFNYSNHFSLTGKVAASGNVMSLRLDDDGKVQGLNSECFQYMFYYCQGLTTAPELPETNLANRCYYYMFYRCTSLTQAPELPATNLANSCYSYMFSGCTSLTKAPELPATELVDSCYYRMFYGCTSLTKAPELPATNLANSCYFYMFSGCTSLTKAPELPATNLAESCYSNMFYGCTSLTELPALPATTLARYCYNYMFCGCSNICISATYDADNYPEEYRIPSVGDGTSATGALSNMFGNTGGTFTGTPDIDTTYYVPAPAPATHTVTWKLDAETVIDTTTVNDGEVPTHADATKTDDNYYTYTFAGWKNGNNTYASNELPLVTEDVTYTAVFTATPKTAEPNFVKATNSSELNNIGSCTYDQAKAWAQAHMEELQAEQSTGYWVYVAYDTTSNGYVKVLFINGNGDYSAEEDQTEDSNDLQYYADHGDVVYYIAAPTTYTVTWKLDAETVIDTTTVNDGEVPTHADATKTDDNYYTYTFAGWNDGETTYAPNELPAVSGDVTYTAQFTAVPKPHTHDGITFQPWTSTDSLPPNAGNYYLTSDVTLSSTWTVPGGTTNLCLNGHGIIRTGSGRVIDLSTSGRNLNIYDCDTVTEHRFTVNNPTENGAGVAVVNDALTENYQTFTGGYITGGNTNNGAGIHVSQATLKLYGGTVIGNSNTGDGGGIYVEKGGNLYIDGGTVSYNQARQGGGIYAPNIASYAKIHLNSGRIEKNYATYTGGGVYGGASVPVYLEGSIVVTGNYSLNAAGVTAAWNQSSARIYVSGSPYVYDNFNANGQSNLSGAYYENTMQITGNLGADCKVGLNGANGLYNYYRSDYTHTGIDPNVLFPYDNNNYILVKDGNNAKRISLYTITFKNYDDEVLQTSKVISGETPKYNGATPTKPADAQNIYTFSGWKDDTTTYAPDALPAVTGDATYTAQFTAVPKLFVGNTITLNADIGVNFFINSAYADFDGAETATVVFTWDDGNYTKEVNLKALAKDSNGCYKATCDVVAAHMAHKIHAVVYLNGTALDETNDFSVQDYAEELFNHPKEYDTKNRPDELKALAKALLNYGAMAQIMFDSALKEKPDLANKNVGATDLTGVTAEQVTAAIKQANDQNTGADMTNVATELHANWYTTTVIYLSKNTVKHYFTKADDSFNASAYEGNQSNYYYFVQKENIAAAELDNLQEFTVGNYTFKYSALDYVVAVINSNMANNAKNIAKALFLYNQAANAYFG